MLDYFWHGIKVTGIRAESGLARLSQTVRPCGMLRLMRSHMNDYD